MEKERRLLLKSEAAADDVYRRLCRAREYMDDCYHHSLDLAGISREAAISPYHFLRLFKQAFDKTPHEYLTHRRIEKAKELLASSQRSVTDICFEVGFQSLGSFSTLFHRHVGHPPLRYRTRMFIQQSGHSLHLLVPSCFLRMYGVDVSSQSSL